MRKIFMGILLALSLSTAMITPSQAWWEKQGSRYYWCEYGKFCK